MEVSQEVIKYPIVQDILKNSLIFFNEPSIKDGDQLNKGDFIWFFQKYCLDILHEIHKEQNTDQI